MIARCICTAVKCALACSCKLINGAKFQRFTSNNCTRSLVIPQVYRSAELLSVPNGPNGLSGAGDASDVRVNTAS